MLFSLIYVAMLYFAVITTNQYRNDFMKVQMDVFGDYFIM